MKPLIHIGYPKTATTWFQQNFYPYVENADFRDRSEIIKNIITPNTFDFNCEKAKNYFNLNKKLIICEEMILGSMHTGGHNSLFTKEMSYRLKSVFPSAQIIIFIRNQIDIIASAYFEYLRTGGTYNINKYLFRNKDYYIYHNISLFSFEFFEYDKIITHYRQLFGKEKVLVFLYEDFLKNNIAFLIKFQEIFNLKFDINKINLNKKNLKYKKYLMNIVRFSNIFTKKSNLYKYNIINLPYWFGFSHKVFNILNKYRIFGKIPSSIEILGKKNYEYIKEYYKTSNRILYEELNLKSIKKYKYPL